MRVSVVFLWALTISHGVQAMPLLEALGNCLKINNQDRRYQCYDRAENMTKRAPAQLGNFTYRVDEDPLTGESSHQLLVASIQGLNGRGKPITLEISCNSTRQADYDLEVQWADFLGASQSNIRVRIGQADAVSSQWPTDRSRQSSILTNGGSGYSKASFMRTLVAEVTAGNPRLVVRTIPYNDDPITAIYDLTGFLSVIQPMRNACGF